MYAKMECSQFDLLFCSATYVTQVVKSGVTWDFAVVFATFLYADIKAVHIWHQQSLAKIPDSQTHIYAQKVKHGCICPLSIHPSMAGGYNQLRDHRLLQISLTPVNLEVNLKENGNRMANTGKSLYLDMYRFEWERGDFA